MPRFARGWPVIKREFTEMARTKAFIIGTILGPVLIALLMVAPLAFMRAGGGGERDVVVLDATGSGIGREVADRLNALDPEDLGGMGSSFSAELREVEGAAEAEIAEARERIQAEEPTLDGFLYLPPDLFEQNRARYEGRNATAQFQMAQVSDAVQGAVRGRRMNEAGVDPSVIGHVLQRVDVEARKPGSAEEEGADVEAFFFIGLVLAMAVYFAVILFATAVMRGVLEEKKDRIVEVLLSSIRAQDFIVGKVMGIGLASLFQMLVWVAFAAAALTWGPALAESAGVAFPAVPEIPGEVAVVFLFFFATGFLLYAAMFGAGGALATSDQEANQMQFPIMMPLMIGLFMTYSLMADPDNAVAVAGSLIPFTAPMVLPVRAMMTDVPLAQYIVSGLLMIGTLIAVMWLAAKIYRIGVLSTGKKPTMKELVRWLRTA